MQHACAAFGMVQRGLFCVLVPPVILQDGEQQGGLAFEKGALEQRDTLYFRRPVAPSAPY